MCICGVHLPSQIHGPGFAYISTHFCSCFVFVFSFLFLCCVKKEIETATTNYFFEACTGQAVVGESACRLLEIDRATYTVGGCTIITDNDKAHVSFLLMSCVYRKKEKKKKKKKVSHPIPSP